MEGFRHRGSFAEKRPNAPQRRRNQLLRVPRGRTESRGKLPFLQSVKVMEPQHFTVTLRQPRQDLSHEKLGMKLFNRPVRRYIRYHAVIEVISSAPVVAGAVANRRDEPGARFIDLCAMREERHEGFLHQIVGVDAGDVKFSDGDVPERPVLRANEKLDLRRNEVS
jgi:hypothetical protein